MNCITLLIKYYYLLNRSKQKISYLFSQNYLVNLHTLKIEKVNINRIIFLFNSEINYPIY